MTTLKESLAKKLTKKELSLLVTSYDLVGDIAVIEIPPGLKRKEKIIAQTLLDLHKPIKVVVKKVGIHMGIYRKQRMVILAGERRKETEHKENDVRITLHVEKSYFSSRSSTERKRIAGQVKKGELILVMFSGVAPYPLVLAKNTQAKEVYGVEINPAAHEYGLKNVKLNKLEDKVKLYKGDVRLVVPLLHKQFDRIIMPLPKRAEGFLDVALDTIKKKGIIHFYDFEFEQDIDRAKHKVKKACLLAKKKCRIVRLVKAGQTGPRAYRLCVDFIVY